MLYQAWPASGVKGAGYVAGDRTGQLEIADALGITSETFSQ